MAPRVVWAMAAPTLANQLARSQQWQLEVADLGDAATLAEASLCKVRRFEHGRVHAVVVCTKKQYDAATALFRRAHIIWALHSGMEELLPPRDVAVAALLAFSHRVGALMQGRLGWRTRLPMHVVVPAYVPRPKWRYRTDAAWAMLNRPQTRPAASVGRLRRVAALADRPVTLYGQDTPGGFLDAAHRDALLASCTTYVSPLPHYAGFGLSQHECLAAGTPLVGTRWGDMPLEMPDEYGLVACGDLHGLAQRLREFCAYPKLAQHAS
ncbi:MAG: glycosyltransferase, partial [Gammaproteobacteria bacterium]|nr:glycosyltransferase [Gammaproteobacteria bacterium]NIR83747.1 glycosyltransferase [Gammaproteobacteria bacterium]NIU05053.1 glycosyltransferase [Gammaproteobacteria bacterium]NIV51909.1 hypothetical protein [Gammaproteobacteria bacterium]NIX86326.1 hypothetical protein [Gammaproteobacteria bacterium]